MDEAVTVRPKGRQEVSAIEELEKLAADLTTLLPRLLSEGRERPVGAGRTEAEVRERERAAFVAGAVWGQERANGIHPWSADAEARLIYKEV